MSCSRALSPTILVAQRQSVPELALAKAQGGPQGQISPTPGIFTASKEATHTPQSTQDQVENLSPRPWETCPMSLFPEATLTLAGSLRPPGPGLSWNPGHVTACLPARLPPPPCHPLHDHSSALCPATAAVAASRAPAAAPGREPCPCVPFAQAGQALSGWGQIEQALQRLSSHSRNPAGQGPACVTSDLRNCLFTLSIPLLHRPQSQQQQREGIYSSTHSFT